MSITIGITAYNEEKNIGKLLENLIKDKFFFELKEIIVVASGCTDKTVDIIKEFRSRKIKLIIEKKRKGKSSAVNKILKRARGEIIVFICADNIPKKGSINKLVKKLLNEESGAVYGRSVPKENSSSLFGYLSHLICNLQHNAGLIKPKILGELFVIRKGIINKIPYNVVNDDAYITALVKKLGYKILYVPDAITSMVGKNSFVFHIRRRRRIARGHIQLKEMELDVSFSPSLILKLTLKRIKKEPSNFLKILFAVFLEILANILASYDTLRKNIPYCWEK